MNIEKIKEANTKYLGKNIIFYDEIDSTQEDAKRRLNELENGTIIIANKQKNGRGTKGRVWYTKSNNIAMTIVLKPKCKIADISNLTIDIAEMIKKAIYELYNCKLNIKKPNDLMINNKKVCGILTESKSFGENVETILIGIGLNVNEINFEKDIENIATSLKKEFNRDFDREKIIIRFIELLEEAIKIIVNRTYN